MKRRAFLKLLSITPVVPAVLMGMKLKPPTAAEIECKILDAIAELDTPRACCEIWVGERGEQWLWHRRAKSLYTSREKPWTFAGRLVKQCTNRIYYDMKDIVVVARTTGDRPSWIDIRRISTA